MSVAERATDGLAAATMVTVPLPLPLLPDEIVSQGALLLAVHAQPAPAETLTFADPPAAGMVSPDGPRPKLQLAAWVTVTLWPAIVSMPVRGPPAAALNWTVPLPVPVAPEVMDSHGALLLAVHAQPAAPVTVTLPVPPCAGTLADVGSIANVQLAAWVTVKVWPAIVSVPVRGSPAAALN